MPASRASSMNAAVPAWPPPVLRDPSGASPGAANANCGDARAGQRRRRRAKPRDHLLIGSLSGLGNIGREALPDAGLHSSYKPCNPGRTVVDAEAAGAVDCSHRKSREERMSEARRRRKIGPRASRRAASTAPGSASTIPASPRRSRASLRRLTLDMQHGGVDFVGAVARDLTMPRSRASRRSCASASAISPAPAGLADAGAAAVIAPMINSGEDARALRRIHEIPAARAPLLGPARGAAAERPDRRRPISTAPTRSRWRSRWWRRARRSTRSTTSSRRRASTACSSAPPTSRSR